MQLYEGIDGIHDYRNNLIMIDSERVEIASSAWIWSSVGKPIACFAAVSARVGSAVHAEVDASDVVGVNHELVENAVELIQGELDGIELLILDSSPQMRMNFV